MSLRKAVVKTDLQGAPEDERLGVVFLDRFLPGFGETSLGHVVVGLEVVHAELDGVESAQPLGHAVVADRSVHLVHPLAAPNDDPEPVREARRDLQRRRARRRHDHVAGHLAGIVQCRVIEAADGQCVEPFRRRRACRPDDAGRDHRFIGSVLDVRECAVAGLQRRDVNFGAGELYVARHVGKHPVVIGRADRIQVHQLQRAVVFHLRLLLRFRRRTRRGRAAGRAGRCAR